MDDHFEQMRIDMAQNKKKRIANSKLKIKHYRTKLNFWKIKSMI